MTPPQFSWATPRFSFFASLHLCASALTSSCVSFAVFASSRFIPATASVVVADRQSYHVAMKRITNLDDIPKHGLKFEYKEGPFDEEGILVKLRDGSIRAYKNECRHLPMRLDGREPSSFFDPSKVKLQCSAHGAVYQLEDGLCTSGPCKGSHLKVVPVSVEDGVVFVDESATGSFFDV